MAFEQVPLKPIFPGLGMTMALSFIAGIVDVVGFVALFGLFTSHFTGNFVLIGKEIVDHSLRLISQLIALPMFVLVVALTRLLVLAFERAGHSGFKACLVAETALLAGCMGVGIAASPLTDPVAPGAMIAAQLGVAAMAVQNAICRVIFPAHPSTTAMTMNLTQVSVDLVDMYRSEPGLSEAARARFSYTAPIVGMFCAGVVAGAFGYLYASFWCLTVPVAGLLAILAVVPQTSPAPQT
jgi:uncharacterized membrane protein YoaK (UPF0700 family)